MQYCLFPGEAQTLAVHRHYFGLTCHHDPHLTQLPMKSWEFLIQQEGEYNWLPIQQPTLELAAGNYRLVAHANRPHLDVDIHITHETEEEGQTLRHCQSYSRRTNAEGLITIFPLREIKPGNWRIDCHGDLISELLGESWQESLQIQVSSIESEVNREVNPLEAEIEEMPLKTELESENILPTSNLTSFEDISAPALGLSLEQDTLIRSQGEAILIAGKVEALAPYQADFPLSGKLRLKLKNADSEKILILREYPLPSESLPFNFSYTLDLPQDEEIPLLIGEAILEGVGGTCLARQSFTIATDINCLAQDTQDNQDSQKHLNYVIELASTEDNSSFAFDLLIPEEIANAPLPLNLAEPAKMNHQRRQISPVSHSVMPPKIIRSSSEQFSKRPQLPKLPQLQKQPQQVEVSSEETSIQIPQQEITNISQKQPGETNISEEINQAAVALEISPELPTEEVKQLADKQTHTLTGEEALQSLKFKERFLSRLNSLATRA